MERFEEAEAHATREEDRIKLSIGINTAAGAARLFKVSPRSRGYNRARVPGGSAAPNNLQSDTLPAPLFTLLICQQCRK
jgi:hypothetical protein